jgi:hypothetical protein
MKRGLDFDKAEAALRRAAQKAIHGTREERSGRFLPTKAPRAHVRQGAPKRSITSRRKV